MREQWWDGELSSIAGQLLCAGLESAPCSCCQPRAGCKGARCGAKSRVQPSSEARASRCPWMEMGSQITPLGLWLLSGLLLPAVLNQLRGKAL